MRKRAKQAAALIMVLCMTCLALTACDAFTVERKTLIDYRHSDEWVEYYTYDGHQVSKHHDEEWSLLYEITYADGHVERRWEECTRFEYDKAREELGEVEP